MLLILGGCSLIYCECIWIGKIYFGVTGALLLLAGLSMLCNLPHTTLGLYLLIAAIACFALESAFDIFRIPGVLATCLSAAGFWKLCPPPLQIAPQVAFPLCAVFGAATVILLSIARNARRNKHLSL